KNPEQHRRHWISYFFQDVGFKRTDKVEEVPSWPSHSTIDARPLHLVWWKASKPSLLERIRLKFSEAASCLWKWWPLLDDNCRRQVVSCILSSSALLHDDLELIDLFAPGARTESGGEPHTCISVEETHGVTWFSAACLAVLAVTITIFSVRKTYLTTWLLLTLLLLLVITCIALTQLLKKWLKRKKLLMSQEQLQQLVYGIEEFGSLAGRAIRLVQESEVIARGFTLSTAALPTRVLDSVVGAKLQHKELRQSLYQAVRLALLALRQATADMLKSYPCRGVFHTRWRSCRVWNVTGKPCK
uniref:Vezatin n=1 Tax=Eptatretus burgeri TaxID=7764 RepID=A0A8C4QSD4_EPTBU